MGVKHPKYYQQILLINKIDVYCELMSALRTIRYITVKISYVGKAIFRKCVISHSKFKDNCSV